MKRAAALLSVITLAFAGCSATPIVATNSAAPSITAAPSIDRTAEVKAIAGSTFQRLITKATEEEPGRLQVDTTLSKSMGTEAMMLCVKVHEGWNYLVVLDVNGSTLATFNHPRNPGICAKV